LLLNGLAILLKTDYVPVSVLDRIKDLNIDQNGLPTSWVIASIVAFVFGAAIMEWDYRRRAR
jgi:hypothetical protein